MNILITNSVLKYRSGTETFVRDLAVKLQALGHYPMIYCTRVGKIADEIMRAGIPVVTDLHKIPRKPDIIHGHHHIQPVDALVHFDGVPGIYVCHDRLAKHDVPPGHPGIRFYVAVDYNCRERFVYAGIPDDRIRVIYNSVDTGRFLPRPPLPSRPCRALVFSNYASTSNYLRPVIGACRKLNIQLDIVGSASGTMSDHPEELLGQYDLVFAKARCAMEAMAVGTAVILCDQVGLGPMVTRGEIDRLRPLNFGMRCLTQPIDEKGIIRQINRYDVADAAAVSAYMRDKATLSCMVTDYLGLYHEALSMPDLRAQKQAEVKGYLDSMVRQVEKSRAVVGSHKMIRVELVLKECGRYWTKNLQKIRKGWQKIVRPKEPVCQKPLKGDDFLDPDMTCHPELKELLRGVDRSLVEISLAEKILLSEVIANSKKGK
jgi:hypothetical protein